MEVLRQLKPLHLYIAADGPRTDKPGEAALCAQTREIALHGIDWPCEVKTLFRDQNEGCGTGVSNAISWFFNQVEAGIILEDDCIPHPSFFEFCTVLLDRYRDNEKIMHIGGNNFQFGQTRGDGDYYYSFFSHNWGWASWKRAWKHFEYDVDNQKNKIRKIYKAAYKNNKPLIKFLDNRFIEVKPPQNHIWDIQWHFAIIKNKGISIIPNKNLVQNIGFGNDGTHTLNEVEWNNLNMAQSLDSFRKPTKIEIDEIADEYSMEKVFGININEVEKSSIKKVKERMFIIFIYGIIYLKKTTKKLIPNFIWNQYVKIRVSINKRNQKKIQDNEDFRINQQERFTPTETFFLQKKLKIIDNASYQFIKREIFDLEIYTFLSKKNSPYIIDCGANIGLSIIYFKKIFPDAEIIGFEPDGKVFDALEFNVKSFSLTDVTLIKKACWDEETILKFYSEGADGGRTAMDSDKDGIIEVETVRLRDFLNKKVDFLKIDIEGAEINVLKDSSDLLHYVDNLFVEYHSFVGMEQELPELLQIIKNAGFRTHITAPGLTSPHPFINLTVSSKMDNQLNIYCFR